MSDLGDAYKKARGKLGGRRKQPRTASEWKEELFPNMQAEIEEKREIIEQKTEKNRELQTRCDRLEAQIKRALNYVRVNYSEHEEDEMRGKMNLPKRKKCSACSGSGYYDHNGSPPCDACNGTGWEVGR